MISHRFTITAAREVPFYEGEAPAPQETPRQAPTAPQNELERELIALGLIEKER